MSTSLSAERCRPRYAAARVAMSSSPGRGAKATCLAITCAAVLLSSPTDAHAEDILPETPGYTVVKVTNGGALTGKVSLVGKPPAPTAKPVTKDHGTCGHDQPDERFVVGKDGALANVVVHLDGISAGKALSDQPVVVDQKQCRFVPHVTAFPLGTKVRLSNSDGVLHTTHAYVGEATLFNIALPMKGMRVDRKIKKTGVLRYTCDAGHVWMEAFSYVTSHPYVTVTTNDGSFSLHDIPPGSYELVLWHEVLGERRQKLDVVAGTNPPLDLRLETKIP